MGWDDADALRAALWTDPASTAILEAVEAAITGFPGLVTGQRKAFTAWSQKVQFAAIKPVKGGTRVAGPGGDARRLPSPVRTEERRLVGPAEGQGRPGLARRCRRRDQGVAEGGLEQVLIRPYG